MKREIKKKLKEDEFVHGFSWLVDFAEKWKKETHHRRARSSSGWPCSGPASRSSERHPEPQEQRRSGRDPGSARRSGQESPKPRPSSKPWPRRASSPGWPRAQLASYWVEQGELWTRPTRPWPAPRRDRKDFFYYQAKDLAAQIAILKGDYDGALKILQAIEDAKPKDFTLDAVLFHKAEALEKKGDRAAALALFKKIQTDYAQSYFGYDAGQKTRKLEAAK